MNPIVNFEEIQVNSNTASFTCQTPKVISLTYTVIPYFCNILNWPGRATNMLVGLIRLLGDDHEWIEIRHRTIGADIYSSKSIEARENSIKHSLRVLKESQLITGFSAVKIRDGGGKKLPDGSYRGIPTAYKLDQIYPIYAEVQQKAIECDLLSLPNGQCQMKLQGILNNIRYKHNFQIISREQKGENMKKEKTEVVTIAKIDDLGERITLHDYKQRLAQIGQDVFDLYLTGLNLGLSLGHCVIEVNEYAKQSEIRAREACKRHNKPRKAK